MKIADTISVNPAKRALGQVDTPSPSILRSHVMDDERATSRNFNLLGLFFPTVNAGVGEYKKYDVPLRSIMATILVVTGISCLTASFASYGVGFAVCSLCFGIFLALGLFTRPVMLGAAAYYCIMGALAIRSGAADVSIFSLMFGCLVFALIGSGKFSCDAHIRKAIRRASKNSKAKKSMDYKVFHNVKY